MAVDLNGAQKTENLMWIVEQIPGLTIKEDVTGTLRETVSTVSTIER